MNRPDAWSLCSKEKKEQVFKFCEEYRQFISDAKTERECVSLFVKMAKENGYTDLKEVIRNNVTLRPGDKVYAVNMDKAVALFHIGKKPLQDGMRITGAHVDSPRLDIKQNPLFEESNMALLDTHYYGGIKKYQWVTLPLALHGVVVQKDGTRKDICIGENPEDPVLGVSDLLVHLAAEQLEKKGKKVIEGEDLNILAGNIPAEGDENARKELVKENILRILKDKYGIDEEDFMSSELEAVPAGPARNYGIDNSMVMGYGHDDRVCAYTSFRAQMEVSDPELTSVCLLVDKEEIGSVGATGMKSMFFENMVAELLDRMDDYSELKLRRALANSQMLSADVGAAFDPNYASVYEKNNSAYLGKGIVLKKFTGARGKSGSSDANAEFVATIRNIFENDGIAYQMEEMGKVDAGGGGTIAYILATYGMEVLDCGIAVMNMHAPWEIVSKIDIYEVMRGYRAFLNQKGTN